ncbi:MAG: lactate dehydrogenase [Bacteroidetes bacterium]|nr:lactate dehydrogenase [Bacteroidota bacterium]MBU1371313.1 lactate dehydrogenase [Bacteroidota bacterium]MBU1485800.1 lactate dehydrogenase [Bacteroidota bacterium]MBU1761580.1 lactate dehydrogenase [Bacteroidota bacterium]MBU2267595.1 lactate dehydrogenase [Bacteroidota bacterium]
MKAVVYSTQSFEKEFIAKANQKKHDITLISNALNLQTVQFAEGKDAVIVTVNDDLSANVINELKNLNVKYITNRSNDTDHIDKVQASILGIKLANVSNESPQEIAMQTIKNLDNWQANKCAGKACVCANACRSK